MGNKIDRRDFLALMGLGGAAVATSCGKPKDYFEEKWHPWVEPVTGVVPYEPQYYATTVSEAGGCGLHVKVVGGRAIKIDGNPEHPINMGKTTARQQSVVQSLYSGDRIRKPFFQGKEITWREANEKLRTLLTENKGKNISALTGPITGAPESLWTRFVSDMGTGQLVRFEPFSQAYMVKASELAFGQAAAPKVSIKGSDMVCSLGAQFLETWGDVTALSREYAELRTVDHGKRGVHVQFEAKMTGTGANADKVHYAKPGSETLIALALLKEVAAASSNLSGEEKALIAGMATTSLEDAASAAGLSAEDLKHVAEGLAHAKSAVVLPAEALALGEDAVRHHVAVLLLNKALGGIGKFYNYTAGKPLERIPSHKPVADLVAAMNAGSVDVLFIKDANPAYALPPSVGFQAALEKVGTTVAFASSLNETVGIADLVIPVNHDLEAWGQIDTYNGISMLQQPVMRPRWDMKQAEDQLIDLLNDVNSAAIAGGFQAYLKSEWEAKNSGSWRDALKKGGRFEAAETGENLSVSGNLPGDYFSGVSAKTVSGPAFVIVESPRFGDGSSANRDWLHELPDTMTGVTWDSWLEASTHYGKEQGWQNGDIVEVSANGQSVKVPVFLAQTNSDHVLTLATGLGQTHLAPRHCRGVNAFAFLSGSLNDAELYGAGPMSAKVSKTGEKVKMATFHLPGRGDQMNTPLSLYHDHDHQYTRDLHQTVAAASLGHGGGHGGGGHHEEMDPNSWFPLHTDKNFYPDRTDTKVYKDRDETFYDVYKWELAIDLNKCTGCGSCVTACYAENNIPVVGKDQVIKGREMAWIRINRYLGFASDNHGEGGDVKVGMLPMMCQQCGNAPCESVCPSLATYHTKSGLNAMVYNRCVGTRYCSNNCSYKVRRFNWFSFEYEGDQNWQMNPEVSVRSKGVMEKCTFCSHRIRVANDKAKDKGRIVQDGEVQTACQQACPSHAISFGNYSDKNSEVYKVAHDERAYRALDSHIHTKPGVSYLKRVVLEEEHHG